MTTSIVRNPRNIFTAVDPANFTHMNPSLRTLTSNNYQWGTGLDTYRLLSGDQTVTWSKPGLLCALGFQRLRNTNVAITVTIDGTVFITRTSGIIVTNTFTNWAQGNYSTTGTRVSIMQAPIPYDELKIRTVSTASSSDMFIIHYFTYGARPA